MSDPMDVEIIAASPAHPDAAALIEELNVLLDGLYRPADNHFSLDADDVSGDRGVFLLARVGREAQGCGAVRLTEDGRGEIKRMYVRPAVQGRGVGRLLLDRLESEARRLGATGLVLEMGDRQPQASALYRRSGFTETPCWGPYLATPASICLGKELE